MRDGWREGLIYTADLPRLPGGAGVYVFARRWGDGYEALYIGKATRIRGRVGQQLNNVRLMNHLVNARAGARVVIAGELVLRGGQQVEACVRVVETALIRHFLSDGHDLVNVQGTRLRQHEVISFNRPLRFLPSPIYLEKPGRTRRS
jgi:hypothetical protein